MTIKPNFKNDTQNGMTLIELMIVVAIVGIIAAIAYPSYRDYVIASRRTDAVTSLTAIKLAQERFRFNCPDYATSIGGGGCSLQELATDNVSTEAFYDLAILPHPSVSGAYQVTATGKNGQENDSSCSVITYDSDTDSISPTGCDGR